ncbi:SxtJ family membrane protein [Aliisedimentitalea scapharcae]|uniref:SxtJ family membrane protein n=1 Tax=Aliisedimentitalea scapharcae TaxID=1524259 RepID=A0ABZ2XQB5_9RHOB
MSEIREHTKVKVGSDRSFGLVFAGVFTIIALFPLLGEGSIRFWALGAAAVFGGLALIAPELLNNANKLWFRFGMVLGAIVSPIVMGILFFGTVTPTGLIRRALGADPLNRSFDPEADSYWIEIPPRSSGESSMKNQF